MSVQQFRDLHRGQALLVLPNAWDAGSAAAIRHAGAAAIATTSAGVAWACGWPDGNRLSQDDQAAAVRRMLRVVDVPLSVDIEEGGADDPAAVGDFVAELARAGVAGINIEDGGGAPEALVAKIRAIRRALDGCDLFINARTDVYLRGLASGDAAVDEVIRRAGLYREAGADGLFAPGIRPIEAIRRVATALGDMPLNVMLVPELPSREALFEAGARRLSAGIALSLEAYAGAARGAAAFLGVDAPAGLDYATLNRLLER